MLTKKISVITTDGSVTLTEPSDVDQSTKYVVRKDSIVAEVNKIKWSSDPLVFKYVCVHL